MSNPAFLSAELSRFQELRRRFLAQDPEIDEVTLADTLEGATSLHEAVTEVVRSAIDDEDIASALRGRLDAMEGRLRRIEARVAAKRELALTAMSEAGIDKIHAPDVTIALRPVPPSAVIADESLIPDHFKVPRPAKLDRRKVLDTLKAGIEVPGAELANSRLCLSVRTK